MSESNGAIIAALAAKPTDFEGRALEHYAKALRKHPRFADRLFGETDKTDADTSLVNVRYEVAYLEKHGWLDAGLLAMCELDEAQLAHVQGDAAACMEELYDAVAVLMRMIAVVEGKQKLGGEK